MQTPQPVLYSSSLQGGRASRDAASVHSQCIHHEPPDARSARGHRDRHTGCRTKRVGRLSLVEKIAPDCAWVAEQAQFVKINRGKIPAYADFIIGKYPVITEMESEHHYVTGDRETKAAYILALDSINFGSGYFHIAQECGVTLEYMVIAGGLKQSFERGAFRLPEQWAHITANDFSQMLSVPLGLNSDLDNLLESFQRHLREAGERIVAEYNGKVLNLLSACDY